MMLFINVTYTSNWLYLEPILILFAKNYRN